MRHPSMRPIRSPGPTIAKGTPERIGQTTQMSRKNSTRKMRLIWLDRVVPTEAAAEHHRLTAPPMHFPQIYSVRRRIRVKLTADAGGSLALLVCRTPGRVTQHRCKRPIDFGRIECKYGKLLQGCRMRSRLDRFDR